MCGILGGIDCLASVDSDAFLIASGFLLECGGIIGGREIVICACCAGQSKTGVKESVVLLDRCLRIRCWLSSGWWGNGGEAAAGNLGDNSELQWSRLGGRAVTYPASGLGETSSLRTQHVESECDCGCNCWNLAALSRLYRVPGRRGVCAVTSWLM